MAITKEILQARVANYESQKEQIIANLNACIGAISEAKALILEFDKPDVEEPADTIIT